jgi:hypothetical protein
VPLSGPVPPTSREASAPHGKNAAPQNAQEAGQSGEDCSTARSLGLLRIISHIALIAFNRFADTLTSSLNRAGGAAVRKLVRRRARHCMRPARIRGPVSPTSSHWGRSAPGKAGDAARARRQADRAHHVSPGDGVGYVSAREANAGCPSLGPERVGVCFPSCCCRCLPAETSLRPQRITL